MRALAAASLITLPATPETDARDAPVAYLRAHVERASVGLKPAQAMARVRDRAATTWSTKDLLDAALRSVRQ
jgi:hypothetical protein